MLVVAGSKPRVQARNPFGLTSYLARKLLVQQRLLSKLFFGFCGFFLVVSLEQCWIVLACSAALSSKQHARKVIPETCQAKVMFVAYSCTDLSFTLDAGRNANQQSRPEFYVFHAHAWPRAVVLATTKQIPRFVRHCCLCLQLYSKSRKVWRFS